MSSCPSNRCRPPGSVICAAGRSRSPSCRRRRNWRWCGRSVTSGRRRSRWSWCRGSRGRRRWTRCPPRRWSPGYRAALVAAERLPRFFPLFMTAAGTVPPAKVLVLGAGVAGLAGDRDRAAARRGGRGLRRAAGGRGGGPLPGRHVRRARPASAGGRRRIRAGDDRGARRAGSASCWRRTSPRPTSLITTAAVPGRPAPLLVTARDGRGDEAGQRVVDLAAESGGNVEGAARARRC